MTHKSKLPYTRTPIRSFLKLKPPPTLFRTRVRGLGFLNRMKILDSHIHIFTSKIIENVIIRTKLVNILCLHTEGLFDRLSPTALLKDMASGNVSAALMLPTSDVRNLKKTNLVCIELAQGIPELFTAGTLHPNHSDIKDELSYLSDAGVRVIKLCSFSQGFALNHSKTRNMFGLIQNFNNNSEKPFSVVLDTLTLAHQYFGTDPKNTTTPLGLFRLASSFPGINFIGAHMGGLGAPFEELSRDLKPLPNLYLDTSNASHPQHRSVHSNTSDARPGAYPLRNGLAVVRSK